MKSRHQLWQGLALKSGAVFWKERFQTLFGKGARHRTADDLLHWAYADVGSDQFGPPIFLEAFRRLHDAFKDARTHTDGHVLVEIVLGSLLRNRLQLEKLYREQPLLLNTCVSRPLFIVGLPRTGSTLLHRLLSHSADLRTLKFWEGCQPWPSPGLSPDSVEPRRVAAQNWCDFIHSRSPELRAAHFTAVDSPEECLYLLRNTFMDASFDLMGPLGAYGSWLQNQSMDLAYQDHKKQLQVLQWQQTGSRWLLKYPFHSKAVFSILKTYPDACFIQTHRHPAKVFSSSISLRKRISSAYWTWDNGQHWLESVMEMLSQSVSRLEEDRKQLDPERFWDVDFRELVKNPLKMAGKIAQHFGFEWSEATEERARRWMLENPSDRFGKHEHSLEQTGFTTNEIVEHFGQYIEKYGL